MMNFYEEFYETFRPELVKFAGQYDHGGAGAEDLFEDCHLALCEGYSDLTETEYLKLMKTSIKNRYRDQFRKDKFGIDSRLFIPSDLSIEERVFRKEEMEIVMLTLNSLSESDKSTLLADQHNNIEIDRRKKSRLKQRFVKAVNDNIEKEQTNLSPKCPQCNSIFLLFDLEDYSWTCEDCGFHTNKPILLKRMI